VDAEGRTWARQRPRRLDERAAHRYVLRKSALVVVEKSATFELEWLEHADRKAYWNERVAGHVRCDDPVTEPNDDGVSYVASMWRDAAGTRLVLLSEEC
jgi:hypothetical protein